MTIDKRLIRDRVPASVRLLAETLDETRTGAECWLTDATLMRVVGLSRRTLDRGLATLRALGYIEVIRDRSRDSGRRIVLSWRLKPTPEAASKEGGAS